MGTILRETFSVPFGDKERDCMVTFDFTPSQPATEGALYVPAQIIIEKIELVDIRKMNFGFKGSKNKNVIYRLDVFDWLDHEYIGKFLNKNIKEYTEACSNG